VRHSVNILVVDDLEKKRDEIRSKLANFCRTLDIRFTEAGSYEDAREVLKSTNIDFVILDLMIPAGGSRPAERWSRSLLGEILDGSLCHPMHVFGLTEHKELLPKVEQYYSRNMFGLFAYDWDSDQWAKDIATKIEYLAQAVENGASYRLNSYDYDLLILTARFKNEFEPVRKVIFEDRHGEVHPLWGDEAHFGRLSIGKATLQAGMICIGDTGLAPAAAVSSLAIQILRPRLLVMLGMCAGFKSKGCRLLDVIVARETACWQEGKDMEEAGRSSFDSRSKYKSCSEQVGSKISRALEVRAVEFERMMDQATQEADYLKLVAKYGGSIATRPTVRSGLLVSGSSIVASDTIRKEVQERHPAAIGLEMEAYALYTAAEISMGSKPQYLVIKGVADLADGGKTDEAQHFASQLSARVLLKLLPDLSLGATSKDNA
jgi:nucleoside phosphorylase